MSAAFSSVPFKIWKAHITAPSLSEGCSVLSLKQFQCYHIRLRLIGFLAFCLLSHVLVYNICSALFSGVLHILTWLAFVRYFVLYIFCFQCLSSRFLKEFRMLVWLMMALSCLERKIFGHVLFLLLQGVSVPGGSVSSFSVLQIFWDARRLWLLFACKSLYSAVISLDPGALFLLFGCAITSPETTRY